MIDVHDPVRGGAHLGQEAFRAIGIGAVREDCHVEDPLDRAEHPIALHARQEAQNVGHGMRPSIRHRPAAALQREAEGEERPEDVGVRVRVPQHQCPAARAPEGSQNVVGNPRLGHVWRSVASRLKMD
jgi:hypothetical protein